MNKYIGVKLLSAEPMNLGDYNVTRGWKIPPGEDPTTEGYRVVYPDGYLSWSPKEVFEKAYLPLGINKNLKTDAPSISQQMAEDFIKTVEVKTMGDKCTVVRAVLRNGFEIVESSACVSAENYDEALGGGICLGKIRDKVWFLLGFLLACGVNGIGDEA